MFAADTKLERIDGFGECRSLSRVEIHASVEEIGRWGFSKCSGLTEVIFATDSRLRQVDGFGSCGSLSRLELPASVERIGSPGRFVLKRWESLGDLPRRELIFPSGTHLRPNAKVEGFRGFVIFEDENDLKRRRRQFHMNMACSE
jgi:hypothetical protein